MTHHATEREKVQAGPEQSNTTTSMGNEEIHMVIWFLMDPISLSNILHPLGQASAVLILKIAATLTV